MLEARSVELRMGPKVLLSDATMAVPPGKIVVLVGRNGAGKTTLLKVMAGELPPNRGQVLLEGRRLCSWSTRELARVRAVLPQTSTLAFPFTVAEVVGIGHAAGGRSGRGNRDYAVGMALRMADVEHLSQRAYTSLSGGEQQRVHLARVLAQIGVNGQGGGRYILLDEPTSSLDLAHQHATMGIVRQLAARGLGAMVILHDLNMAAMYADKIALMDDGAILAVGPPSDVLTAPLIRQVFHISVEIRSHPTVPCPLVVDLPAFS